MNNEEKILSMLENLTTTVATIQTDIKGLKQEVQDVKQEIQDVKQEVQDVKQEIQDVKSIQIRMEHEHGQKLGALFDGYKFLYDIVGEMRSDIITIKNVQEKQNFQIRWLNSEKKLS